MSRLYFCLILILTFSFVLAAQESKDPKPANPTAAPSQAAAPKAQPAPPAPVAAQSPAPQPAPPAPANAQSPAPGHTHAMPGQPGAPGMEPAAAPQPPQPPLPATTPVITLDYCHGGAATATTKAACKKVITREEFDRILDAAIPKSRRPAGADIPPQVKQAVAKEYLNMYIMANEAEKRGYPAKDPVAQEMLKLSRIQVLSIALNQELQENAKPTDAEIESYYKNNPSAFVEVGLRRLYIPKPASVPPTTSALAFNAAGATPNQPADAAKPAEAPKPPDQEALKAAAEKLHDNAAAGEDLDKLEKEAFEAAGNKQTPPPTQMGNRRRGILPPDQDAEIFALNTGQVSKLFDNAGGWYLYKVESKRTLPLSEVKDEIQRKLQPEKLNDARQAITGKVKSDFNEKYFGGPVAAENSFAVPHPAAHPSMSSAHIVGSKPAGKSSVSTTAHKPPAANTAH